MIIGPSGSTSPPPADGTEMLKSPLGTKLERLAHPEIRGNWQAPSYLRAKKREERHACNLNSAECL